MTIKNIYKKTMLSANNKRIEYNMCENVKEDMIQYGIQIIEYDTKNDIQDIIEDISIDKNFVYNLITHLYENVIGITHFRDIVEDYIIIHENEI